MTAEKLIEFLQKLPKDAKVYYTDHEYNGSIAEVRQVDYSKNARLGVWPNSVIIS